MYNRFLENDIQVAKPVCILSGGEHSEIICLFVHWNAYVFRGAIVYRRLMIFLTV